MRIEQAAFPGSAVCHQLASKDCETEMEKTMVKADDAAHQGFTLLFNSSWARRDGILFILSLVFLLAEESYLLLFQFLSQNIFSMSDECTFLATLSA